MDSYKDLETGGSRQVNALANEAIGTFFITLAVMAGISGWGALAAAGMVAFFTWFEKSGQYNAAVTLSQCIGKNRTMPSFVAGLKCIVAQISGSTIAVLFSGVFNEGSAASVPVGSLNTCLADVFLTLVLLYTFDLGVEAPRSGLDLGLAYFSGLSAFPSALGANASIVLGVFLGNAALGNGLNLGMDLVWAFGAPAVTGAVFPFLYGWSKHEKIPRRDELIGTFLFALLTFAIGFGNAFAVGTSLHTISNIFPGTYNPAITLAVWAKSGFEMSVVGDPILDILAQVVGCTIAAIVGSSIGSAADLPAAADVGPPALFEVIFAIVLALVYLGGAPSLTKGLSYFAVTTAFASSFNPAFGLGLYVAGLAGFGGVSLAFTLLVDPLVAGVIAGLAHGRLGQLNELVGTLLLTLFVGSTGSFALGCAFVALHTIYTGGAFNPALTLAKPGAIDVNTLLLQIGGAVIGGLAATYGGMAANPTSSGGLSDGGRSMAAEVLLAALLAKTYDANGNDYTSTGLSYFGLLATLGLAAGSIANPALVLGNWVGNGLLGSGFDFGADALLGLVGHVAMPLLGAKWYREILSLPEKLMLSKIGLEEAEVFCSFLAVLGAAAIESEGEGALAYALVLMTIFNIYTTTAVDIFPAVSAYRTLGAGDPVAGLAAFMKKLAAQLLGALLAALAAAWLFADGGGRQLAGVDLPAGLLDGLFAALLFCSALGVSKNTLNLAVSYFAVISVFSGATMNGAAFLATALVGIATGGGASFATDTAWWSAFLAPIVGGVLAGRLAPCLGK